MVEANKATRTVGRPAKKESRATNRPKRSSFNSLRDVLATKGLPEGKVGRWVNDTDDRIYRFAEAGWEFVTDKNIVVGEPTVEANTEVGAVVCRKVGGGVTAYLMVLDKDEYDAREQERQDAITEQESTMFRDLNSGKDGTYGKVKVS